LSFAVVWLKNKPEAENTNENSNDRKNDAAEKANKTNLHIGKVTSGSVAVGDYIYAEIDLIRRNKIRANHSATHLLHAALRNILGIHVKQKGSLVDDLRLRFDFEHHKALTREEILSIELQVNEQIRANKPTITEILSIQDALDKGAIALFDDKYQEKVLFCRQQKLAMFHSLSHQPLFLCQKFW
jgi:alanyl-tRNA synthetase